MSIVDVGRLKSDSFTVTVFQSGSPSVDLTLRNDLVPGPSEDWVVGVCSLSAPLDSTVFLDGNHTVLMELRRIQPGQEFEDQSTVLMHEEGASIVPGYPPIESDISEDSHYAILSWTQDRFRLRHDRTPTLEFGDLMESFNAFSGKINSQLRYNGLNKDGTSQADNVEFTQGWETSDLGTTALDEKKRKFRHLMFRVSPSGMLSIIGSGLFWSTFWLKVSPYFQALTGFSGVLSVNVSSGNPLTAFVQTELETVVDLDGDTVMANTHIWTITDSDWMETHAVTSQRSLWGSCDTRLDISLACDLPVSRALTITDGKEVRDYTLGSWALSNEVRVTNTVTDQFMTEFEVEMQSRAGHVELKKPGPPDYWVSMLPNEHLRVLRLRLMIRERVWNETTAEWSIVHRKLPLNAWQTWNCKLLFCKKTA